MKFPRFAGTYLVAVLAVTLSACRDITNTNYTEIGIEIGTGGGGPSGITVSRARVEDYFGTCVPNTFTVTASKPVVWSTKGTGVISASGTGLSVTVTKNKIGEDQLIAKDPNDPLKAVIIPVVLTACPTVPPGGTPVGILSPVGPQTMKFGQKEIYFSHFEPAGPVFWRVSGSCVSTREMGTAAGTGHYQAEVTAIALGTCKLKTLLKSDTTKVSNEVVFTVVPTSGAVGNAYMTIDPVSWTTTIGGTKQFTATCHNFPTGTECKPYFYSIGTGCVAVNGIARIFTNDPVFGTGTYPAGYAKARASNCTARIGVQASASNTQIYTHAEVVVN